MQMWEFSTQTCCSRVSNGGGGVRTGVIFLGLPHPFVWLRFIHSLWAKQWSSDRKNAILSRAFLTIDWPKCTIPNLPRIGCCFRSGALPPNFQTWSCMQQDWAPPPGRRPHLHPLHPAANSENPNIPDQGTWGCRSVPAYSALSVVLGMMRPLSLVNSNSEGWRNLLVLHFFNGIYRSMVSAQRLGCSPKTSITLPPWPQLFASLG